MSNILVLFVSLMLFSGLAQARVFWDKKGIYRVVSCKNLSQKPDWFEGESVGDICKAKTLDIQIIDQLERIKSGSSDDNPDYYRSYDIIDLIFKFPQNPFWDHRLRTFYAIDLKKPAKTYYFLYEETKKSQILKNSETLSDGYFMETNVSFVQNGNKFFLKILDRSIFPDKKLDKHTELEIEIEKIGNLVL